MGPPRWNSQANWEDLGLGVRREQRERHEHHEHVLCRLVLQALSTVNEPASPSSQSLQRNAEAICPAVPPSRGLGKGRRWQGHPLGVL